MSPKLTTEQLEAFCRVNGFYKLQLRVAAQSLIDLVRAHPGIDVELDDRLVNPRAVLLLAGLMKKANTLHEITMVAQHVSLDHALAHTMADTPDHTTDAADALLRSVFAEDDGQ